MALSIEITDDPQIVAEHRALLAELQERMRKDSIKRLVAVFRTKTEFGDEIAELIEEWSMERLDVVWKDGMGVDLTQFARKLLGKS